MKKIVMNTTGPSMLEKSSPYFKQNLYTPEKSLLGPNSDENRAPNNDLSWL